MSAIDNLALSQLGRSSIRRLTSALAPCTDLCDRRRWGRQDELDQKVGTGRTTLAPVRVTRGYWLPSSAAAAPPPRPAAVRFLKRFCRSHPPSLDCPRRYVNNYFPKQGTNVPRKSVGLDYSLKLANVKEMGCVRASCRR